LEGAQGSSIAVDVNPKAGGLIRAPYDGVTDLVIGDICTVLASQVRDPIDLYWHDTTTSELLMQRELPLAAVKLSGRGIMVSSWHALALMNVARDIGKDYAVFCDEPFQHWYPGSKMGLIFKRLR